ncbi:MAG: hypothetical protein HMLKMBBP_00020 [Planctomycetes bacterium]|nr:hypothetical protein [Planctomycetota bacterium]
MNRIRSLVLVAPVLAFGACATPAATSAARVRWEPVVVWEGDSGFETVKVGRPDSSDPDLQIVGVDQAGHMVHVAFHGGVAPAAAVIYENHSEMTGLCIADADPEVPGEEIYAGCYEPGQDGVGGNVVQVVKAGGGWRARRIFDAGAYVHGIAAVPPATPGGPVRLVAATYANELHVLTPHAGGTWTSSLAYGGPRTFADPQPKDPRPRMKDVVILRDPAGRAPHEAFAVVAGGDVVYADLDRPGSAKVVHQEEGGYGRVCVDEASGAYACGYWGRVQHFVRDGAGGWKFDVIDEEGKSSGLRGIVTGRFPLPGTRGGDAPLALYGFHALCRLLVEGEAGYDPVTIFRDSGRGHTQIAADLVPGNDADEIVLSGYSKKIVVLVARR